MSGGALGRRPSSSYLGGEHVHQAVGGSVEREAPDQVDDEHTVGQRGREIHHLWAPEGRVSPWSGGGRSRFARNRPAVPMTHDPVAVLAADSRKGIMSLVGPELGWEMGWWDLLPERVRGSPQDMCPINAFASLGDKSL